MPTKAKTTKRTRRPLAEFTENGDRVEAWITTLPEWPEILEGWKQGKGEATIRRWLVVECGYDPEVVSYGRVHYLSRSLSALRGNGG